MVYHGHDAIRYIAVGTLRGRGRASSVETRWEGSASTWTLRDGKVVRVAWFASREEALDTLGRRR